MKTIYRILSMITLSFPLIAELNDDNYTAEDLLATSSLDGEEDQSPFSIDISFEGTGKSKFKHEKCKRHLNDVQFSIAEIDGGAVFYYNPCCKEGLLATLAYSHTRIHWKNPYFNQQNFDTVSLALGGFTERACNWVWKGEVRLNADVDYFKASENLYWNIVLAGRFAYMECLGLNMGFIVFTGMKIDRIYPIIGIDWKINDQWKINLIYPTNIGIFYNYNKQWSFSLSSRSFDERHRVGDVKKRRWERGLIEYRATGVEAGVNFITCNEKWLANFHVGEILGGRVKVSKHHHNNIKRYKFKTAPYIGGEIAGRF